MGVPLPLPVSVPSMPQPQGMWRSQKCKHDLGDHLLLHFSNRDELESGVGRWTKLVENVFP